MAEFPTFSGSWPWPWIGSYGIPARRASLVDLYLHTKFTEIE